jgi:hypothetical protein
MNAPTSDEKFARTGSMLYTQCAPHCIPRQTTTERGTCGTRRKVPPKHNWVSAYLEKQRADGLII